jgi:hypothetical protein
VLDPFWVNKGLKKDKPAAMFIGRFVGHVSTASSFSEDYITDPNLLSMNNFQNFPTELEFDNIEDSSENMKKSNYSHNYYYLSNLLTHFNYIYPSSYTYVMDAYRPEFDDEPFLTSESSQGHLESNYTNTIVGKDLRLSNPLQLRVPSKAAIKYYNARRLVAISRWDEGRSNAR